MSCRKGEATFTDCLTISQGREAREIFLTLRLIFLAPHLTLDFRCGAMIFIKMPSLFK